MKQANPAKTLVILIQFDLVSNEVNGKEQTVTYRMRKNFFRDDPRNVEASATINLEAVEAAGVEDLDVAVVQIMKERIEGDAEEFMLIASDAIKNGEA